MFALKFLKKDKFDDYDDYMKNAAPIVPARFNFAYDVVDAMAAETPDRVALLWTDDTGSKRSFTFQDLSEMSNAAANFLISRGVGRGDAVLLFLRRRWEYWILMIALHKIGAVPIPSTNQLKAHDIKYRIGMADVKHIVAFDDGHIIGEVQESIAGGDIRLILNTQAAAAIESFPKTMDRIHTENTDTMVLYFTSGTTDMPKMVAHDFTYPLGHINTALFWQGLTDGDLHFTLSESGWAKCSWGKMYGQWMTGATVFVYDFGGKFPADELLRVISENRITSFCAPPTVYKMLIREDMTKYDLSSIKKADIAGEALNPEVFEQFLKLTGVKLREGFGQTETAVMLFNNEWIEPKPGSMGMPAAGWDVRLLDERGRPAADGEVGEICVSLKNGRPVGLFQGYYKNEKQNSKSFRDGYYHTGDVAYRDAEGYFWFVGRNDDLIKSSGYRISPFEVESVLLEHPSVREVAVTGVPDDIRGMAVKATIVLNKYFHGTDALVYQLQDYVKNRTAPYKYPRVIEFVETLPMTISGKIKRALIRALDNDKMKKNA
ncbi:MAG: AMP-binding protein [Rickettsiales bacterium]|nr:AMP-binding protein [Rickettsiales bacterium]